MTLDRYRPDFPWPPEAVDRLRTLYAAENTYRQCAAVIQAEFGGIVTTGAIAGKVDRVGLRIEANGVKRPPRTTGNRGRGKPKVERRAPLSPRKLAPVPDEPEITDLAPDSSVFAVPITNLRDSMCRYPLGVPAADMLYCGAASHGPWCPRHRAIVYKPAWRRD